MTSGTPGTSGTSGIEADTPPADPAAAPVLPVRWPSAWSSLWPVLTARLAFVAATAALTGLGLLVAGDPRAQWWLPALPLVLLAGPLLRPARVRRRLSRAAAAGRLAVWPGRVLTGAQVLFFPAGARTPVPLPAGRALAARHGSPALLVTAGWAAAVVLHPDTVRYLSATPRRLPR
jgi:hypothetical protein